MNLKYVCVGGEADGLWVEDGGPITKVRILVNPPALRVAHDGALLDTAFDEPLYHALYRKLPIHSQDRNDIRTVEYIMIPNNMSNDEGIRRLISGYKKEEK